MRKLRTKLTTKWVPLFLVLVLILGMMPISASAAPEYETSVSALEGTVIGADENTLDLWFDPLRAVALQGSVVDDFENFGDLAFVLHTLGEPRGMVGFEGGYALPSNPNELVEISVQFVTPPSVVLELMSDVNHPYVAENVNTMLRIDNPHEMHAITAHANFLMQLAQEVTDTARGVAAFGAPDFEVLDSFHTLFNGKIMQVPAFMVEQIAALDEVFVVTPNYKLHPMNDVEEQQWLEETIFFIEAMDELAEILDSVEPADLADWTPGSNSWSANFMRESRELFELDYVHNELGITGAGIRGIVVDSGIDSNHPRYHRYHYTQTGQFTHGLRVPGRNNNAGNPSNESNWSNWGDGGSHGTHVSGSVTGMAPDVTLYVYGAMGIASLERAWQDGFRDGVKYYTHNVVNMSFGSANVNPYGNVSYATSVMTLSGFYLMVASAGNNGPGLQNTTAPGSESMTLTVGAGLAGGFVSPFIYENVRIDNQTGIELDVHAWDWGWMPLDENGWREAFPEDMEEIMEGVFSRPIEQQDRRWRWGNGLNQNEDGSFNYIWLGAMADTAVAREAAAARLRALDIDVAGSIIIQARNAAGSPGTTNPRDFWAQQGAGALIIVADNPNNGFHYSGGAGPWELIQGSIPILSMRARDGQRALPFPAGIHPHALMGGPIPVTTNAETAAANVVGVTGTISLGALTNHVGNPNHVAPNYLAGFSSPGPQLHTYHILPNIVGPGVQVHSTFPAHATNRFTRALRNADGDFVNAAGEVIGATGNPVACPQWLNNPQTHRDWSIAYALQMGTSMSAPTVAGLAALVWQAHPDDTPQQIIARIMNTAAVMGSENRPDPYHVYQVGAGFVNPRAAIEQQAIATALVPIPWNHHANRLPGQAPIPPAVGNPAGLAPPSNWVRSSIYQEQGALSFGIINDVVSHEITVTIRNAGTAPWTPDVRFNTAIHGVDATPHTSFHPDVALRVIASDAAPVNGVQTFTFVMEFPEDIQYGLYNGNVVFTNGQGGRITMPFAGVPYIDGQGVAARLGSGVYRPIIAVADGELTAANRTTIDFALEIPSLITANANDRVIDFFARRVNDDGSFGETRYVYATSTLFPNAAMATGRFMVASRVNDPANPGQFLYLQPGIYELFAGVQTTPPRLVDGVLIPGVHAPLSVGQFIVAGERPTVDAAFSFNADGGVTVVGTVFCPAHELAIANDITTIRAATNLGVEVPALTPTVFDYRFAQVTVGGTTIRPNADGTFEVTLSAETATELLVGEGITATVVSGAWNDFAAATGAATVIQGALTSEVYTLTLAGSPVFSGSNPNVLREMLDAGDVILSTPGNLGIFSHHSPFVVPEGTVLIVTTTLNVQRDAELIIEGTVIVLNGARINNQGGPAGGGTISIANTGTLINFGHVENVTNSAVVNYGTIVNNARFEVRADTRLHDCGEIIGTTPLNIHRNAILCRCCEVDQFRISFMNNGNEHDANISATNIVRTRLHPESGAEAWTAGDVKFTAITNDGRDVSAEYLRNATANVIDIFKHCTWETITLTITVRHQTEVVTLYNNRYNHGLGTHQVVRDATCTEAGYIRTICNNPLCSHEEVVVLPPLGHNIVDGRCTRCDATT